jgi:N-formylglutamate amidohydrolase
VNEGFFTCIRGEGPLAAVALHSSHDVREEVAALFAISDEDRLREEDPYTDAWTAVAPTRIVARRSRFEVDLNRPREKAVYIEPKDAWDLKVWRRRPSRELIERSLAEYDGFYATLKDILYELAGRHGGFVILDMHSYNHRRDGPDAPAAPQDENPDLNIGTDTMNRDLWAPLVDRFMDDMINCRFRGSGLDVRENVKFGGGHLAHQVHEWFPDRGCVIAVEYKKIFMDEWTGKPYMDAIDAVTESIRSAVPGILEEFVGILESRKQ